MGDAGGIRPTLATVKRLEHHLCAVGRKSGYRRVREPLREEVDDARAIRPDGASAVAEIIGSTAVGRRRGDRLFGPRATAVG